MNNSIDHYRITDFLEDSGFVAWVNGNDPETSATWESWMKSGPPNLDQAEQAIGLLRAMRQEGEREVPFSKEDEFAKILHRIMHRELISKDYGSTSLRKWLRVAAVIILLLVSGTGYLLIRSGFSPGRTLTSHEITVPKGSRTQITLEDGSTVWLNAESTLKYPSRFARSVRQVELTGEAYFTVTKSPDRPFVVLTSDVRIKVLGTSFNVKAYPNEDIIETTLESGLVNIEKIRAEKGESGKIILKPRQKLVLYKSTLNAEITEVKDKAGTAPVAAEGREPQEVRKPSLYSNYETELATSWKDGKLIFRGESLDLLTARLEKSYNVNIRIADPELNQKTYTGTFENETIEQALEALCLASDIKFTIEKNDITIYK
ncbi:MAG TPA: DUF4974 domain-containing protein [Bacteroides sp.]|nr:DUF4974 domain-containing protein [Bacteroides sp.]